MQAEWTLSLGNNAVVKITKKGAHVISWTNENGIEQLYTSPLAVNG